MAILTIIGYSLNDTVVVFDRVREYMENYKKKGIHEYINTSLNSTLSRTINTSLTTFVVLLIIFLFGGEAIKGFMFALMIGVVVGTYSSLFVASPIMVDTISRKTKNKKCVRNLIKGPFFERGFFIFSNMFLFIGGSELIFVILFVIMFFGGKNS